MVTFYNEVFGWIGDETTRLFDLALQNTQSTEGIFVELGTYRGKSSICVYDKVQNTGKNIQVYTVDNWSQKLPHDTEEENNKLHFLNNKGSRNINLIEEDCFTAHSNFSEKSIDFLFIDVNIVGESLSELINLWLPKIKTNGIISGHDYHWEGIGSIIDEKFLNVNVLVENEIHTAEFDYQPETWSHHAWYVIV